MKIRLRRMSRLLSVATLSVALFSCADEEIVGGGPRVQEGLPAQIVLKVASGDNRIETRAAQDAANEKRICPMQHVDLRPYVRHTSHIRISDGCFYQDEAF